MIYYLENSRIILIKILHKKLGFGKDGKVYQYHNKAIKINYPSSPKQSYHDSVHYMRELDCDRILLPREELTDVFHHYIGYSTDLIKNNDLSKLFQLKKNCLIEELYQLRRELVDLSAHFIVINDWCLKNTMYDGRIRIIDPGDYFYVKGLECKEKNIEKFNRYVVGLIFSTRFGSILEFQQLKEWEKFKSQMKEEMERHHTYTIDQFLEKDMRDDESFLKYSEKKLSKK